MVPRFRLIRKTKFTTNRKEEKRVKYEEGNSLEEQTALLEGYEQRKRARANDWKATTVEARLL